MRMHSGWERGGAERRRTRRRGADRQMSGLFVVGFWGAEVGGLEVAEVDDEFFEGDAGVVHPDFDGVIAGGGNLELRGSLAGFVLGVGVPVAAVARAAFG